MSGALLAELARPPETTAEAAERFLDVMARAVVPVALGATLTTTCAACGEPCPAHPEGRGPVACSVACFNRLSVPPVSSSTPPHREESNLYGTGTPPAVREGAAGSYAPHGRKQSGRPQSDTRTGGAVPFPLPDDAPCRCGHPADAHGGPYGEGTCEATGPNGSCECPCTAFVLRELTYTTDDPTTACDCPASVRATGRHSAACPVSRSAPVAAPLVAAPLRADLMRVAAQLADHAATLGDGADALWLANIADELRAFAVQLGEPAGEVLPC